MHPKYKITVPLIAEKTLCYHCGDDCREDVVTVNDKHFCCPGCKLVYEIVLENNLCTYYDLNSSPGIQQQKVIEKRFNFLDDEAIQNKLITFKNKNEVHVVFHIPTMHCSSCIWLLENFKRIDEGVHWSRVNFLKKEIALAFDDKKTSLRKIVEALAQTGYEPSLQLDALEQKEKKKTNRSRILRIGVAGFCFGNIMMLSFPEYFSSGKITDPGLKDFFGYMNLLVALPVFFYSASEFFIQSYRSIKHKTTSIDIPIAIGIAAIFLRSVYEVVTHTGSGFFDSGSGLIFFMLIGRWFQDYTFDALSFDRDYKSYFPIAVTTIKNGLEKEVMVDHLKVNDKILIRNNEIIPVDGVLLKGAANIDYHFVTGESVPVHHQTGETIFAGGRQIGSIIELQVMKEVSQSHLTQLWNKKTEEQPESSFEKLIRIISKYFIAITLLIAFTSAAYWWGTDYHKAINAFTAVLVIACPCALALSAPFAYGNLLRILGRNKIYLRNYQALEKIADINTIVFDKTGTITESDKSQITFDGDALMDVELKMIYSLVRQSSHPLSKLLATQLQQSSYYKTESYEERIGEGIVATINGATVKVGNRNFVGMNHAIESQNKTKVFVSINNQFRGAFSFDNKYRSGLKELLAKLSEKQFSLSLLTGDNESEKENLIKIFPANTIFQFNQSPNQKANYIDCLKQQGNRIMMIGDGLNDAGALMQSDVGVSITDNTNAFSPASSAIVAASQLVMLPNIIAYAKTAYTIIVISFIISLLYNLVGLSFAITGTLSPMIAAILMPISTISLVLFNVIATTLKGKQLGFK